MQDVQPETWLNVTPGVNIPSSLNKLLAERGRALITATGTLFGPRAARSDVRDEPTWMTVPHRVTGLWYGHNGHWRTQFEVDSFIRIAPVADTVPHYVESMAKRGQSLYPVVTAAAMPLYPRVAQIAGISGMVRIKVDVVKGLVSSTTLLSGDRLLADEAESNIKTWQFDPSTHATFETVFKYVLESRQTGADRNAHVCALLPSRVDVVAPSQRW